MHSSPDHLRHRPRRVLVLLALAAFAILVTGVVLGIAAQGDSTPAGVSGEGRFAPDFSVVTLDGAETRLSDYRGQPVVLTFFASWCYPCEEELPRLEKVAREAGDGLQVLAVVYGDRRTDAKEMFKRLGVTFPGLIDDDRAVASAYGVRAIPQSFFIDADGRIQDRVFGVTSGSALHRRLQVLLSNAGTTAPPGGRATTLSPPS